MPWPVTGPDRWPVRPRPILGDRWTADVSSLQVWDRLSGIAKERTSRPETMSLVPPAGAWVYLDWRATGCLSNPLQARGALTGRRCRITRPLPWSRRLTTSGRVKAGGCYLLPRSGRPGLGGADMVVPWCSRSRTYTDQCVCPIRLQHGHNDNASDCVSWLGVKGLTKQKSTILLTQTI